MKILDCTLRDGGYYNNWDFPETIVNAYLKSVTEAGIDFIELGLRNFPKAGFLGAYAYTTEEHLKTLDLPSGPTYGVMVDAKTILASGLSINEAVDALFCPANESKVDLVRVAAHFHEVEESGPIIARLKELGYIVGYNLMQAGGKACELIAEKARVASSWGENLDVLYFADSLGNMNANEVERIIKAIRQEWNGKMGIHTHDNMSKGLDNSMTASKHGVEWLDSTITGMGRGAGNTQTERLLASLQGENDYNPQPVYDLVIRYFESMQREYGWGTNLLYFLGAQNDVHPTYIQNLLTNSHYGTDEIVGAISYLSNLEGTSSYNGDILVNAISFNNSKKPVSGTDVLGGVFEGKEVLFITNSPSVGKYKKAIENYIEKKSPIVISLNINEYLDGKYIDYYVMSHNAKFLSDFNKYKCLQKPLIMPLHRFEEKELEFISGLEVYDYGFDSNAGSCNVNIDFVSAPYDITTAYAFGVALNAKAKFVSLVGYDGFDKNDHRQIEMIDVVQQFQNLGLSLKALTPTSYPVKQGSIYAFNQSI